MLNFQPHGRVRKWRNTVVATGVEQLSGIAGHGDESARASARARCWRAVLRKARRLLDTHLSHRSRL
ncbi:hypothetical protein KCP78_16160 [Salmonella enterica subsp. enterica]|nr:hypothetical protein KCP78_16160 [Salmonella enterica subsp. enterica]